MNLWLGFSVLAFFLIGLLFQFLFELKHKTAIIPFAVAALGIVLSCFLFVFFKSRDLQITQMSSFLILWFTLYSPFALLSTYYLETSSQ